MERIVILGCAGTGKTTFARQLGERNRAPVICLDEIWKQEQDVPKFRALGLICAWRAIARVFKPGAPAHRSAAGNLRTARTGSTHPKLITAPYKEIHYMLKEGDKAPAFKVLTDTGEEFDLAKHQHERIVLYFYPRADTPGCTIEACEFRDTVKKFEKKGVTVIGVSPDTTKAQSKFKEKFDLNFTLLADDDKTIANLYGVMKEKNMYGKMVMGVARTTFLIDNGKITKVFTGVKPEGHAEEILAAL